MGRLLFSSHIGKGMVSGRNTVLWESGIYPGENKGIGYADTYRRKKVSAQKKCKISSTVKSKGV